MARGRQRYDLMRFTIRQLEYFIAAGETGSITQASERISISQPSISTAISQLEQELDVQLFIRHHAQGLSLTPAGRMLLIEAKRLLDHAESLYTAASETSEEVRGQLNVGCLTTLAPMILPELSLSFMAAFPKAGIRPHADHQEFLLNGLHRAMTDVAITYDLQIPSDIEFTPLVNLPVHAVVGESHPLARHSAVTLGELAELPLILLDLPLSAEYFMALFMKERLTPNIAFRFSQPDVIRTMVANGYGYTLGNVTPRSDTALDGRKVIRVRLSGDHRPMTIGIATLKQLKKSRLLSAFANHARSFISDAYIPGMIAPVMSQKKR
jgi:DNA-binding transcriptional LysR family regulator